ncbi:MAG: hypothetical protein AAGG02_12900 [Cyanobacteria bacterium P01_H01_bin.15]
MNPEELERLEEEQNQSVELSSPSLETEATAPSITWEAEQPQVQQTVLDIAPKRKSSWLIPGILGASVVAIAALVTVPKFITQENETTLAPNAPTPTEPVITAPNESAMLLAQAELLAEFGDADSLTQAIAIAETIPTDAPEYAQAQTQISAWQEQVAIAPSIITDQSNTAQLSQAEQELAALNSQIQQEEAGITAARQQQQQTREQIVALRNQPASRPTPTQSPAAAPAQETRAANARTSALRAQLQDSQARTTQLQQQLATEQQASARSTSPSSEPSPQVIARAESQLAQEQARTAALQEQLARAQAQTQQVQRDLSTQQQATTRTSAQTQPTQPNTTTAAIAKSEAELAAQAAQTAALQDRLAQARARTEQMQQQTAAAQQAAQQQAAQQQTTQQQQTAATTPAPVVAVAPQAVTIPTAPAPTTPTVTPKPQTLLAPDDPYLNVNIPNSAPPQPAPVVATTVPSSSTSPSYGFRNVVASAPMVAIELRDNVDEDGDYVTLRVNGKTYVNNKRIWNRGEVVMVPLQPGENKVEVVGVRDGQGGITLEVNVAGTGNVNSRPIPEGSTATFIINRE